MTELDPKDNWEAWFDHNFMRWFHLNGEPAIVTIVKAELQELTMQGGIKKRAPVATLRQESGGIEDLKPLVLNKTNARSIAVIHGSKPSDAINKRIELYQTTTDMYDKDLKQMVTRPCIRVRAARGKKVETLSPEDDAYVEDIKKEIAAADTEETLRAIGFIVKQKSVGIQDATRQAYADRLDEIRSTK